MAVCVTLAAPAQAADPIKIGVQGAQSGDLASYGVPSLNAVKIVVDQANAKGGLLGRTIEVVAQDDQCKPEMATNAATKLISEKVNAVVGPICSGPTKASLPMFQEAALIAVSPTATTPGLTEDGKNREQIENVLAAIAAAWALGITTDVIRTGVETFFKE